MTERISAAEYRKMNGVDLPKKEGKDQFFSASSSSSPSNIPPEDLGVLVGQKPKRPNFRPKQIPGKMNKTEQAFTNEYLQPKLIAGEIYEWQFEPVSLKLAKNTFYRPDFLSVGPLGVCIYETKGGHVEDDARAKWKIAADKFWWMRFFFIKIKLKKGKIAEMTWEEYRP